MKLLNSNVFQMAANKGTGHSHNTRLLCQNMSSSVIFRISHQSEYCTKGYVKCMYLPNNEGLYADAL